jgi:hypothetical protein
MTQGRIPPWYCVAEHLHGRSTRGPENGLYRLTGLQHGRLHLHRVNAYVDAVQWSHFRMDRLRGENEVRPLQLDVLVALAGGASGAPIRYTVPQLGT